MTDFNTMCRLVEATSAEIADRVERAALFEMWEPDEPIPVAIPPDLFLPFPRTCIFFDNKNLLPPLSSGFLAMVFTKTNDTDMLLDTLEYDPKGSQIVLKQDGLTHQAGGLLTFTMRMSWAEFMACRLPPLSDWVRHKLYDYQGHVRQATPDEYSVEAEANVYNIQTEHMAHVTAAIALINSPYHFIFENAPVKAKPAKGNTRIRRRENRPIYTMLKPQQIHKIFGTEGQAHASPVPHGRRRHYRTLRSPIYGNNVGKRIIVRECWVGVTEKVIKDRLYTVRLDI